MSICRGGGKSVELSLDEFMALPQTESVSDIHCVTQWSLRQPLEGCGGAGAVADRAAETDARHVMFHSFDGLRRMCP
jgi:DMSO/TMAO reductase YedYZ molybdopterin-dependent catalytic subunit